MKSNKNLDIKNIDVKSGIESNSKINSYLSTEKPILYRQKVTIKNWRSALNSAEQNLSMFYPLISIYNELELEADVISAKDLRKNNVLSRTFRLLDKNYEETEKLYKWKTQQKWFSYVMQEILDSIFFGYTLLNIKDIENDNVTGFESLKREHFNPKTNNLLKNYSDTCGININDDETLKKWLIKISPLADNSNYLGLYAKIAPYSINQRMGYLNFAEYLRRTGNGMIIVKSDVTDEIDRQNIAEFGKNIESSYFAVIKPEDEISFLEASGQGSATFKEYIETMRSAITKIILGNDTINTEKSFVGSAQIAAAQSILYSKNDIKFVENVFNNQIFPQLKDLGLKFLDGVTLEIDKTNNMDLGSEYQIIKDLVLSGKYEVDDEYFMEKFGIPIKKIKTENPDQI